MFKGSDEEIIRKTGNGEILAPWVCINTDVYDLSPDTEGMDITSQAGNENLLIYFNSPERLAASLPELQFKLSPKDELQADFDIIAMVKEQIGFEVIPSGSYLTILLWNRDDYRYTDLAYEVEGDEIEGNYEFETDTGYVHLAFDGRVGVWRLTIFEEVTPPSPVE